LPRSLSTLKRILTIMKTLVGQVDILETMTPLEFLSFRDRLESASGFQSFQFRELEFVLGIKNRAVVDRFPARGEARRRLEERFERPSLWDAFLKFLAAEGHPVPGEALRRDVTEPIRPSRAVQELLIDVYRNAPPVARLCERLVDLDEGVQEWRYRHLMMVERTLGAKGGTGGSSGIEYLRSTLFRHAFPDLWAIRSEL
jgi:tryptophan 2,3-dioxygenase